MHSKLFKNSLYCHQNWSVGVGMVWEPLTLHVCALCTIPNLMKVKNKGPPGPISIIYYLFMLPRSKIRYFQSAGDQKKVSSIISLKISAYNEIERYKVGVLAFF